MKVRFGVQASACPGGTDIPVCPLKSEIMKSEIPSSQHPATNTWKVMEQAFRVHAFLTFYHGSFSVELDAVQRFAKALVASVAPIRDPAAVIAWYRGRKRGRPPGRYVPHARGRTAELTTKTQSHGEEDPC